MNLLLLLSALLSALSGVAASTRVPQVTQAVATSVTVRAQSAERRVAVLRPLAPSSTLADVASVYGVKPRPLPTTEPLWASRRRE